MSSAVCMSSYVRKTFAWGRAMGMSGSTCTLITASTALITLQLVPSLSSGKHGNDAKGRDMYYVHVDLMLGVVKD